MKSEAKEKNFEQIVDIHEPFRPQDVRENDPVKATIRFNGKAYAMSVWRISPFGIELINENKIEIDTSSRYKVNIEIGNESSSLDGVIIYEYNHGNKNIICIRFVIEHTPYDNSERRSNNRWSCSSQFYPTGIANSPAKFNDFIYFKIKDISYGGMKVTCSLRNKFLFPQMTLNAIVNFPMISQVNMKLKIENINIGNEDGRDVIRMGVSFSTTNKDVNEIIANYLMQFSNVSSLQELKSQGFYTRQLSNTLDFNFVKTEEDYEECLKLRLFANQGADKLSSKNSINDMADSYDSRSRIVFARHGGKTVCTVRLAFHEIDDQMEIEEYTNLPESFPRRDETIEIMRLCTHPDYRGADLLMSLFKHLAIVVVQSKRKYIVTSCVEELKPLYQKIGFKETSIRYENPLFKGHPDEVMIANVETLLLGTGMNPIVWNLIWGDLYSHFDQYALVDYTPIERLRVKFLRSLNPIAKLIEKKNYRKLRK